MYKIVFIITTMLRDELLYKSVQSLLNNWQDNFTLVIIDQGNMTEEKKNWISQLSVFDDLKADLLLAKPFFVNKPIYYKQIPFDSGLSKARNEGVKFAKELGCDYVFIGSDSFLFNNSIQKLNNIVKIMEDYNYDLIGVELDNSTAGCGWEGKLRLIPHEEFELNFIDKLNVDLFNIYGIPLWNIDICRNIFIAKTNSLLDINWDENLKLAEHEDFFIRYKQENYKCGWTNYIYATKMTNRPNEYKRLRETNWSEGLRKLREKWGIKGWVSYIGLDMAKEYYAKQNKSR